VEPALGGDGGAEFGIAHGCGIIAECPSTARICRSCAERLSALAAAGAERGFVWPVADELRQLGALAEDVIPLVT